MSENMNKPLLEVKDLKQYFNISMGAFKSKPLKAVDGVSFSINKGETLGLVGESGCGKTTVGRTVLHLYKPTAGEIWYNGKQIVTKQDIQEFRKKATMVFQDPYSSLNPRMTVADIIGEPLDVHKLCADKAERQERILELMGHVGLNSEHASRYAHEFSGGQRQRLTIARALIKRSPILILDDSASALDYATEAKLRRAIAGLEHSPTVVIVSQRASSMLHADKIVVLDDGNMVGVGTHAELLENCEVYRDIYRSQFPEEVSADA